MVALAALLGSGSASAGPTPGQLQDRISRLERHEQGLRSGIQADNRRVRAFQGRLDDLGVRLEGLQASAAIEERLLNGLQGQLRGARARLLFLQDRLVRGRAALRAQLVADYESPPPDLVTVLLDSHGFADLLERVDVLRRIEHGNVRTTLQVRSAQTAVSRQAARLADLEARQERITRAVVIQRDQVGQLRAALGSRQSAIIEARARKNALLGALQSRRRRLEHQLYGIEGSTSGGFLAHGGTYGFFQYPGTNYSVGNEPEIARRLDRLGKALHLHLIGISGYRTPQHSVEVGGFANDPHTAGAASDTPGVEGVPEATLRQFGLTRPFGGAREANHIQLA